MVVTFCGHSQVEQTEDILNWLEVILSSLIAGGADKFYFGGYGDFDHLAELAVQQKKAIFPQIERVLVLAYLNRNVDVSRYDSTIYPPLENVPFRYAILKRNQWMIESSDVVVSGVTHNWGGAAKTLAYAKRKGKCILQAPHMFAASSRLL